MSQRQLCAISAFWFAVNLHWGALLLIIMPSQVARISPQSQAEDLSIILGIGALVALVLPPFVGAYSDRCASRWGRRRPYMAAGVVVNLVGLLTLWGAGGLHSFWLYLVGYLVVQFGNNLATASYSGIIPDLVPDYQRGEASGYMAAMTQMGTVLGAVASGFLMDAGHVAASYLVIAVALVLFLSLTLAGTREQPLSASPAPLSGRALLKSFWMDPRKHPDFAWVWITRALVTLGMWTVQPYIQYYLRDVVHVLHPEKTTGYLLGTILIGATVTGLLGGRWSDRIGRKRVIYATNTLIALTYIGFLFVHSLEMAYLLGIVYGLGYGAYYSVDWALGCDVLPNKEDAAKYLGIWHIAMVLPQSIAPFIAGPLLARFGQAGSSGHYALPGYTAIFCLAAFFLLLSAVLLRNVRGAR